MFNTNGGYSLADIAAVTDKDRDNNGWGEGGAWWIIILFLFVFCGWGGNGFGGFGGNNGGALTRADLCQDMNFSDVESGIRGIQSGLCDGFYALNTSLLNGFHGVDNAICTLGYQTQQGFNNLLVSDMQNTNAITAQLTNMAAQNAACCCETQRQIEKGFCDVNYNLATQSCATQRAISDSTRDIIDSNNAGVRSILDFLTQDKIANLQSENQTLKLAASQQAQNAFFAANQEAQTAEIIRRLGKDYPIPAYVVPNPNCCYPNYGCGCGSYSVA